MEDYIELGYWGLFLTSFLAATVIPLSSEIVLSVLIANGFDFIFCLLVATLGNWLGGLSSYGLGWLANWEILERYFGIKQEKVFAIKKYINPWGSPLAFLCWLPLVGDVFAVALGFFRVSFPKVSLWMLLGKLIRYTLWGLFTLWGIRFF